MKSFLIFLQKHISYLLSLSKMFILLSALLLHVAHLTHFTFDSFWYLLFTNKLLLRTNTSKGLQKSGKSEKYYFGKHSYNKFSTENPVENEQRSFRTLSNGNRLAILLGQQQPYQENVVRTLIWFFSG